jgi:hypothetical protein
MSDGSRFTAVAQAVNEAKWLVDYQLEQQVDRKLLSLGFLREDLFKFNKFRMYERLEMKEKLLSDVDLLEVKRLEKEERNAIEVNRIFVNVAIPILEKHFKEEYPDWGKK